MNNFDFPSTLYSGAYKGGHVQGIAVDTARGYVYYSFTTLLVKTNFEGQLIGSVTGLVGHLGCITFDPVHNRVIGSLELKHDSIGKGIMKTTGVSIAEEDAFYLVAFDGDAVNRPMMDAEADRVMLSVWLSDVVDDYTATDEISDVLHRYGCSGIDGVDIGPAFGEGQDSPSKIMVAYGIYGDVEREDNDHQVILQYDLDIFDTFGQPLVQIAPHHNGPLHAEAKYFFYTGNTTWGVQNLAYDPASGMWLMAVYQGQKQGFENYPMFLVDGSVYPHKQLLTGRPGETGLVLTSGLPMPEGDIRPVGCDFPLGSTGIHALGDGRFVFSSPTQEGALFATTLQRYRMDMETETLFVRDF